jgi:hypothetical protein
LINEASTIYQGKSIAVEEDEEVFSSRRHLMDYVTVDGIIKRTGYTDKKDWYLLVIKELFDNTIDWLWNEYQGADEGAKITAEITVDKNTNLFHCRIRNTNPQNIPIFRNLQHIFNYEMTYGSKQNEFKVSRGTLGDAMKYIAALPYVLANYGRDKSHDFSDLQWDTPMYIRHNGVEREVLIVVDEANSTIDAHITPIDKAVQVPYTDTEIEVTYPIIEEVKQYHFYDTVTGTSTNGSLNIDKIAFYCKQQKAGTTDISFDIRLIENDNLNESRPTIEQTVTQTAAHTISDKWSNMPSVKAYTPQEFRKKIFGVHDKANTTVFRVLQTFREGTHIKKRPDLDIPISELAKDHERVKALYYELRGEDKKNKLDNNK